MQPGTAVTADPKPPPTSPTTTCKASGLRPRQWARLVRTPVGIKIMGADLATIERLSLETEAAVSKLPVVRP